MLGTFINCCAIVAGCLVGFLFRKGIPERYNHTIMQAVGLSVSIIGLKTAWVCDEILIIVVSMIVGTIIGELFRLDHHLDSLSSFLESKFAKGGGAFSTAFVSSTLLYCVGAMAVVGSLESGLLGKHDTLFAKSCLDGITAVILASSLGIGVMFSAFSVLVYQGIITLAAGVLKPFLIQVVINQMSGVGGLLILGLGINVLLNKEIKVVNMLPAIFMPLIYFFLKTQLFNY